MKVNPPPPRLYRNLIILEKARALYFTSKDKGLPPYLLSTLFWFVREENRIPLTRSVLPLIRDDNNRKMLTKALDAQGDQWEPPEPFKPAWSFFRGAGIYPTERQQIDDLLQLDYPELLNGMDVPDNADIDLFWGGLADFLVNSWSILEEFCSVVAVKSKIEQENKLAEPQDPRVKKVIDWRDMQLEHHLTNIVIRLRAGWDKLASDLLIPYYGISNPGRTWPKRLNNINRELSTILNAQQKEFWENLLQRAQQIAVPGGLRDVRDFELHNIASRSKETLGSRERDPSLEQMESFAVTEHYRLQDGFLLFLGMVRGRPLLDS